MSTPMTVATSVVLATITAGAMFELAVAVEVISMGSTPDEGPTGEAFFFPAALIAMLAGSGLAVALAARRRIHPLAALIAPAGALFLVCDFYTFDPYYLPDLRRYSEGIVPPYWVFGLALLALAAGWQVRARSPFGLLATAAFMPLCAMTAIAFGIGK